MPSKTLCRWCRVSIVFFALCGLAFFGLMAPAVASMLAFNPGLLGGYIWALFLGTTSMPCVFTLVWLWKISGLIRVDQAFSHKTARLLKRISSALLIGVVYFLIGNTTLFWADLSRPILLINSILLCIFGAALAILVGVLSSCIAKAAEWKDHDGIT